MPLKNYAILIYFLRSVSLKSLPIKLNFKIQSFAALGLMWATGIIIFLYLSFSNQDLTGKNVPVLSMAAAINKKLLPAAENSGDNDAYVFINLNKKHLLTRFVASVTQEEPELTNPKNSTGMALVKQHLVERVNKKLIPEPEKKPVDFAIRPTPGLLQQ